jgi:UPF0716 protein FxsA
MGAILLVLLIGVPIAELWVIVQVADGIGILWTLLLLFVVSIAGARLLRQQGTSTWKRLRETTARGGIPTEEVTDGAMILLGGALLLTPGFLTDVVGILLLVPPTRAVIKRFFRRMMARRVAARERRRGIYTTRVVKVERTPSEESDAKKTGASSSSTPDPTPDRLPSAQDRADEGGSPGTR